MYQAIQSWEGYLNFLWLSFLIGKMRVLLLTLQVVVQIKQVNPCRAIKTVPATQWGLCKGSPGIWHVLNVQQLWTAGYRFYWNLRNSSSGGGCWLDPEGKRGRTEIHPVTIPTLEGLWLWCYVVSVCGGPRGQLSLEELSHHLGFLGPFPKVPSDGLRSKLFLLWQLEFLAQGVWIPGEATESWSLWDWYVFEVKTSGHLCT